MMDIIGDRMSYISLYELRNVNSRKEWIDKVRDYDFILTPGEEGLSEDTEFPTWLGIMHEEEHDNLGHPMGPASSREEQILREKDVWSNLRTKLSKEKWFQALPFAISSLSNYIGNRKEAENFINSLN